MEKNYPPKRKAFIHPQMIMIYLVLAGVTALFLGFATAYVYTRIQNNAPPIRLPWLFFISTLVLFLSGRYLRQAKDAYESDTPETFVQKLKLTLALTILFLIMQSVGWLELIRTGIPVDYSTLASYIYIISATHLVHVLIGIPFLAIYLYRSRLHLNGTMESLIFFADPDPHRHLKLLSIYWLFLDRLWIALMVFFWLNWAVKDMNSLGI